MNKIRFTSICWKDANSKINIVADAGALYSNFDFDFQLNSLLGLCFVFQAFPKNYPIPVNEYTIHRRKTKVLEIYLILDYEKLMAGTDAENLRHVKEVFVHGCEKFLKPMKGFRYEEFLTSITNYELPIIN